MTSRGRAHSVRTVLEAAYPAERLGANYSTDPPSWVQGSTVREALDSVLIPPEGTARGREPWLPDDDTVLRRAAEVVGSQEEPEPIDPHVLAFYIPYSLDPRLWGIYYLTARIEDALVQTIGRALRRNPGMNIRPSQARILLYGWLREHEQFHARVELASAHWLLATSSTFPEPYLQSLWDHTRGDSEEMLGTALESDVPAPRGMPSAVRSALWYAWQDCVPAPYNRWQEADKNWDANSNQVAERVGGGDDGSLFLSLRFPDPLDIPEFRAVPRNLAPLFAKRIRGPLHQITLSCQTVQTILRSAGMRADHNITEVSGGRESVQFTSPNASRPMPLTCHGLDLFPDAGWLQIADLLGIDEQVVGRKKAKAAAKRAILAHM